MDSEDPRLTAPTLFPHPAKRRSPKKTLFEEEEPEGTTPRRGGAAFFRRRRDGVTPPHLTGGGEAVSLRGDGGRSLQGGDEKRNKHFGVLKIVREETGTIFVLGVRMERNQELPLAKKNCKRRLR